MTQYVYTFAGHDGSIQIEVRINNLKWWVSLESCDESTELVLYSEPSTALSFDRLVVDGSFSYLSLDEFETLKVISV